MKKCLKILPYVYEFKTNLILSIICTIIGVVCVLVPPAFGEASASIFTIYILLIGPLVMIQVTNTGLLSQMIGCSPKRKALDYILPNIMSAGMSIGMFLLYVVVFSILLIKQPENVNQYSVILFFIMLEVGNCQFYSVLGSKKLVLGTILYFIGYFIIEVAMEVVMTAPILKEAVYGHFAGNWMKAIVECAILLAMEIILFSLIRKLLYKKPMSTYLGGKKLSKIMQ